jgi:Lar family restriction alleviation protein
VAELLPCPFCGAEENDSKGVGGPELRIDEKGHHFVFCFGCGTTGPQHAFFQTEAIPSWNTRAPAGVAIPLEGRKG